MFSINEAALAQELFCDDAHMPMFAPRDGWCDRCQKNIYRAYKRADGTFTGISVERAGETYITRCPHCGYSFVE